MGVVDLHRGDEAIDTRDMEHRMFDRKINSFGQRQRRRASRLITRFYRDRSGAIAIMVALLLPMMLGMVAITVDVGIWYAEKRGLQNTADAASMAGGSEIANGSSNATIVAAALADANRNDFDPVKDTITINIPPVSGPNTGNAGSVEIIISRQMPLFFTTAFFKLIGDPDRQFNATARAVANTIEVDGDFCILGLDLTIARAVNVFGTGTATLDCGIAVNSNDDNALSVGGTATLTTTSVQTVGGISVTGTLNSDSPPERSGAIDDPYEDLEIPDFDGCDAGSIGGGATGTTVSSGSQTFDASDFGGTMVLCGGLKVSSGASVILEPGVYIIDQGDFEITGGAGITGEGVTIILTSSGTTGKIGKVKVTGGGDVQLSAPTSSPDTAPEYSGVLFYQDRLVPESQSNSNLFAGGPELNLEGVVYFPSQELNFTGGSDQGSGCTHLIAQQVSIGGDAELQTNCDSSGTRPIKRLKASLGE